MGVRLAIRQDMAAEELRRLARQETDGRVACRLLGVANALDGMSRGQAARQAGMDRQTLRDWVIRFNAEGVEGLRDRPKSGRPPWLDEGQLAAFKALVLRGPDPERDGVSTWRAQDLCRLVEQRFGVVYSEIGMLRLLHDLGLSWQKARPMHPEADRSFAANAFGLHDMHGNVAEWVLDCIGSHYEGGRREIASVIDEFCLRRVIRGGSWQDRPSLLRSASRYGWPPSRVPSIGIRVARDLETSEFGL